MAPVSSGVNKQPATRAFAIAAVLIALGNIASRVFGLVREIVIAGTFGRGLAIDAFTAASAVPTLVYDLLINGAISAALVPVFSEYAEGDRREFRRVVAGVVVLAMVAVSLVVALLIWQAPAAVALLAGGFSPIIREQATRMVRLMLPAVLFMALSGLITAVLYARQRFLLPAFTASAFNIGIIAGALLLAPTLGIYGLVVGVVVGAFFQVVLQLPGLLRLRGDRDKGAAAKTPRALFRLHLHPGVRRILWLYAPVALGIGFSVVGIVLDRNLASRVGDNALATMRYATTLVQFPLGLVAAAVSFAVLPTLSRQAASSASDAFRSTLGMGFKVIALLILPATAGLAALATPIVRLVFEHGQFTAHDTSATASVLLLYLPGLPAAAFDQMLLFAFYARQRTLTPNLVQGAAVAVYAVTALGLLATTTLGVDALVIANSAQWIAHALLLLLLSRQLFSLHGLGLGETIWKCALASAGMAVLAWLLAESLASTRPLVQVTVASLVSAVAYFGACLLLRVEALTFFVSAVRRRF